MSTVGAVGGRCAFGRQVYLLDPSDPSAGTGVASRLSFMRLQPELRCWGRDSGGPAGSLDNPDRQVRVARRRSSSSSRGAAVVEGGARVAV